MLKEKFGVKRVGFLSYVGEEEKSTPNWLVKKLDSGYFCKSDLNWHGWPVKEFEAFTDTPFDILIDLELEPVLPLKFVVRKSTAGMKVGVDGTEWCEDLDFRIVPDPAEDEEELEEVDVILKDPMEEWKPTPKHLNTSARSISNECTHEIARVGGGDDPRPFTPMERWIFLRCGAWWSTWPQAVATFWLCLARLRRRPHLVRRSNAVWWTLWWR